MTDAATFTPEELDMIRQERNAYNRAWWAKQSPEQRRERRRRYDLNRAIRRRDAAPHAECITKNKKKCKCYK